jgi:HSP20 family protein
MYRRYRVPAIWREMDRLQREMNRLFESYSPAQARRAPGYPAVAIWANDESLVLTAEVPGVDPQDIDVSVVGENLTLSGQRKPDELDEGSRYHRQERGYGKFSRAIQLPFPVEVNDVEATFKDGLLQVKMSRAEEDKPRKITVKSA